MKAERWSAVERLYHDALGRAVEDRAAFLREACGGDEELRREVESLLAYENKAKDFLENSALEVAGELMADGPSSLVAGQALNHYKILELLGAGGMGEVYLAEDTRLKRRVAVKLLPAELTPNGDRLRRFEREAWATSALNHPNILTIHEIGEAEGHRFLATEFIEGLTLRERLQSGLDIDEALEITIQVASALEAAHRVKIVHRDVKPENIMMRKDDGLVKVLDFGLAKMTHPGSSVAAVDAVVATALLANTGPGVVMGTVAYMSPEQARGAAVDERTDIWSLGCVAYEMLAGCTPFVGASANGVISAILSNDKRPPLARYAHDVPERLEAIVAKALAKEPEERYQTISDMLIDLKRLKQKREVEGVLERSISAARSANAKDGETATNNLQSTKANAAEPIADGTIALESHPTPSAKHILTQIKNHKRWAYMTLGVLLITAAALTYFFYLRRTRAPVLTDKDTILLSAWVNTTGDPVFDSTLKQGLAMQLQQSPFLSLFADAEVPSTLRLMGRSPDEKVTREIGREICQRRGLKALVLGSIAKFDRNYSITLEAINSQTGETIALTQVEAEGKDQVLKALSQAASELREKLGENLSSIQKFDAPLEVTTSSLEALKAYSLGRELASRGKQIEAISFAQRAVELDPNFAMAYLGLGVGYSNIGQPQLGSENFAKAYPLRDRVSEMERLRITYFYYLNLTGELDKAIGVLEQFQQTYPRDVFSFGSLATCRMANAQFEEAAKQACEVLRLAPKTVYGYGQSAEALILLGRFPEAKAILEEALREKLDLTGFHLGLYEIAFVNGDAAAMQEQLDWTRGKRDEYVALNWQADTAAYAGEWQRALDFRRQAIDLATRKDANGVAARYAAGEAVVVAVLLSTIQSSSPSSPSSRNSNLNLAFRTLAQQALALERSRETLRQAAFALALAGDTAQAQSLVDELAQSRSKDTIFNSLWLPVIRATLNIRRGNAQQAIQELQPALRYEPRGGFWAQYVRGTAYLSLKQGAEAATEFQKILDHRGEAPISVFYPLAHLGLARAAALAGDTAKSRKSFEDFFALWKDADLDLPLLLEARKEYQRLR